MPGLLIIGALLSAKAGFQIYAIWHQVDRYYENKCANHLLMTHGVIIVISAAVLAKHACPRADLWCNITLPLRQCGTPFAQVLLAAVRPDRAAGASLLTAY